MGIYMVSHKVLSYLPTGMQYGFDDLMITLLNEEKTINVKTFHGYWLDIGRPDDYIKAIEEFDSMKDKFLHG